nr:MAG TPA: hypothetical protein [Caudoviricetes sp.]
MLWTLFENITRSYISMATTKIKGYLSDTLFFALKIKFL